VADKVLVYQYMYWDESTRVRQTSRLYATAEVIRDGLGTPIHASAIEVSRAELRDGGIYVPPRAAPSARSQNSSAAS
jgi:hypothetical protein